MAPVDKLVNPDRRVSFSQLRTLATSLDQLANDLRVSINTPHQAKTPPVFTSSQVADLCGIDRAKLNYLTTKEGSDLPPGQARGKSRSKLFSLKETRELVQKLSKIPPSPLVEGKPASATTILVAQLKGGSAKTTTAFCMAQALTLRGRRVLFVDLDPQGTATEVSGILADGLPALEDTVLSVICDSSYDLRPAIKKTYWDGLDIIPSHPGLLDADFQLPAMIMEARLETPPRVFKFWAQLRAGLAPLKAEYDYIIFDTSPSLSYMNINAIMAADGLVFPLVPEALDFMSSLTFWSLFADTSLTFENYEKEKTFEFISVLLTKVDMSANSPAPVVRHWAQNAYGEWLHPIEVPESKAMKNSALGLCTVFDLSKGEVGDKSLLRVKEPLERYAQWVDELITKQRRF